MTTIIKAAQQALEPIGYINAGHLHELQQKRAPYAYVYRSEEVGASVPIYTTPQPQPAPSPQPAVPVVSDEQIRKTVESIQDPDTVHAFHNGYYTLTPDEMRRVILALRPQAMPMTLEPTNDVGLVPVVIKPFTPAQRRRLWDNSPEIHKDAASITGFERIVSLTERAHGITAPAGGEGWA